ncbi:MAG: DUF4115 domain-containing protein [Anaerolineaceae bacterium]|nr:DUF4115 domain-containing protein [Anaerolineaceae bacterium]
MPSTIGETLANARKEKHLTLEQVGKDTHIRIHYLEALEKNQFDLIPSKAQAKGFLRLYLDYLKLESQPFMAAWETGFILALPSDQPETPIHTESSGQDHSIQTPPIETGQDYLLDDKNIEPSFEEIIPLPVIEKPAEIKHSKVNEQELEESEEASESKQILQEIGYLLKNQRDSLGLTLEDIERYTHVRVHHLQAIENGQIEELPSTVQGRGMIHNYAKFLDLDSDEILHRFADALQIGLRERLSSNQKETTKPSKRGRAKSQRNPTLNRFLTPDLLIGSLIILFIIILSIWGTTQVIQSRNEEIVSTAPGISEFLLVTPSLPLSGISEVEIATSTPTAESQTGEIGETEDTLNPTNTLPPALNAPLQVYVVSHQRTYLKVLIDGEEAFNGRVVPGNAYPFDGEEIIEVLSGNAAALQIFFNQEDLGTLGSTGQVIDLIFTNSGIITPTPMFTSTPTQTIPPTITLQMTETPDPTMTETVEN